MSSNTTSYVRPESDSDSDYDGFYFGNDPFKKDRSIKMEIVNPNDEIINTVKNGGLETLKMKLRSGEWSTKTNLDDKHNILSLACTEGQFDMVEFILNEMSINANSNINYYTPLYCASDSTKKENKFKILKLLVKHNALLDGGDICGKTALMNACSEGDIDLVHFLIKQGASVNIKDRFGCTALFYAIELNNMEMVKTLLVAGADESIVNYKGYTVRNVAENYGFNDILEILPQEKLVYQIPFNYLYYNTINDYIPQLFLNSDCPAYFQDIKQLLDAVNLSALLEYFAKSKLSLAEFLVMNEKKMKAVGILMPLHRQKILKLLLDFHLNHWSAVTIARISRNMNETFYEILMITANHLQNLVLISSSIRYVSEHINKDKFGLVSLNDLSFLQDQLETYQKAVKDLHVVIKYLSSFSPPHNPLYIDYEEYLNEKKRSKMKKVFKYTTLVIGVSVFICFKLRKFLK